jgi:hypothetical protein
MRDIVIGRQDPFEDRMDQNHNHAQGHEILNEIKRSPNDLPLPID